MASHTFTDLWHFKAPIGVVWNEIADPLEWPNWWPGMERVEQVAPGDELNIGAVHRYTVKGALPYRVSFEMRTTVVEVHRRIEGEALGDVKGTGRWSFSTDEDDAMTHVRYDWTVEVTKGWLALLSPLLRPLYEWNHHVVMRRGERGLTGLLARR